MNCVIVDNNPHTRTELAELLSQMDDVHTTAECKNEAEALNILKHQKIDVLLIDIGLPGTPEVIKSLRSKRPVVIFINNNKEHLIDHFDLHVADCITKPVTPVRLVNAIEKARHLIYYQTAAAQVESLQFVFVRENGALRKVMLDDIDYIEAMGDYVKIFTRTRFYMAHTKLRSIQQRIPSSKFLKVHRSFIIALDKIDKIEEGVIVINQKTIPVADGYRAILNSRLHIL